MNLYNSKKNSRIPYPNNFYYINYFKYFKNKKNMKYINFRKSSSNKSKSKNNFSNYNNRLIINKITFILFFILLASIIFIQNTSFAATPKIVTTLTKAFENIEDWFLKLATPAAAVAVGVGVFMKKFSFGDEERLRTAKKIIKGSLFSYGFLLALDLILQAIKSLI